MSALTQFVAMQQLDQILWCKVLGIIWQIKCFYNWICWFGMIFAKSHSQIKNEIKYKFQGLIKLHLEYKLQLGASEALWTSHEHLHIALV